MDPLLPPQQEEPAAHGQSMNSAEKEVPPRGGGGDQDRLSALPDCLLHAIMSFLKARQAVQTCVLSRRWRHLWRSVPCLDVDLNEFRTEREAPAFEIIIAPVAAAGNHNAGSGDEDSSESSDDSSDTDDDISGPDSGSSDSDISGPDAGSSDSDHNVGSDGEDSSASSNGSSESDDDISGSDSDSDDDDTTSSSSSDDDDEDDGDSGYYSIDMDKEWEDFEDFTVNLMHRCNIAQLDSFRLHIDRCRAPQFGHRQVAGWLRRAMKYCTPDPSSQRKGLSPSPWRLKRLHLCRVHLDNRFAKHVSSVCCTLEDLELHDCSCQILSVTSDSLKTLVLKNCRWRDLSEISSPTLKTLVINGGSNSFDCLLVILVPALAYLHLAVHIRHFRGGISTNEMSSLIKASIHLRGHRNIYSSKLRDNQLKLLCSVSNVTSLELSGVDMTVLGKEPNLQEFMNLRNLLLGSCELRDDFRALRFLLQSSPNLEKLTLQHCKFPNYPEKKKGKTKLNNTPSSELHGMDFLCGNLKVEIIYKHGDGHQLVKLLLHASGNLSKNNIKLTKVN